jgi:8-oxo-dGTP diphosphatase
MSNPPKVTNHKKEQYQMIKTRDNKYNGTIIDSTNLPKDVEEFKQEMIRIIDSTESRELLWIKIPIEDSDCIPVLTKMDFEFHHCDERNLMLIKRLKPDSFVPTSKNFIVGVGAIVLKDGKLLVVKDRFSVGYKLPGGHIDRNESIKNALKREVAEETGIDIEFESIVNLGHFKNGQFGESNLYIVCTAKARSENIEINDLSEISEAKWIAPDDFINSGNVNTYNKSVVRAAINNKELKLKEQEIELRVPDGEVFF